MPWVTVAKTDELPDGRACMVEAGGRKLAVCKIASGVYTIDNKCTHDGGPLGEGKIEGQQIICPRHGARFDVTDGKVKALPAVRPVKSYPTRVTGGDVEVDVP